MGQEPRQQSRRKLEVFVSGLVFARSFPLWPGYSSPSVTPSLLAMARHSANLILISDRNTRSCAPHSRSVALSWPFVLESCRAQASSHCWIASTRFPFARVAHLSCSDTEDASIDNFDSGGMDREKFPFLLGWILQIRRMDRLLISSRVYNWWINR